MRTKRKGDGDMSKLVKKLVSASTGGLVGKTARKAVRETKSAKAQAAKLGATVGKPSEKALAASARDFPGPAPTVSAILGGEAEVGFGGSARGYRRRPLQRSR
jgi:hypothetical protein